MISASNSFSSVLLWAQRLLLFTLLLTLAACSSGRGRIDSHYASGRMVAEPVQCVPYARQVSGVQIYGDAHTWWTQAATRYQRGNRPKPGAVLVLARSAKMRHGHVAVVRRLVNARQIDVTHSNWGNSRDTRRIIYDRMRVEDISAMNDWTRVRFWNPHIQSFGLPYEALGFIYP